MKTRPRAERALCVNLITADPLLIARLKLYCRRNKSLQICFSRDPMGEGGVDAFVFPASALSSGIDTEKLKTGGCLLVCYGAAELLRSAFLAGCDDYLKEPWSPEELECRLARLSAPECQRLSFSWGELALNGFSLESRRGSCALSYPEYRILHTLVRNRGEAVPREALYYAVQGKPAGRESRTVDVHVSALRKKLQRLFPESCGCIRNLRGVGYLIR